MRFESMNYERQMRFLRRLHATINREFFDGALQPITLDICNINKGSDPDDAWAMYGREWPGSPYKILFAHEFMGYLKRQSAQWAQAEILFQVMLHEMVHQYCKENDIEDTDHNEQWQKAAADHGLHSVYVDGQLQEEWLLPITLNYERDCIRVQ